MPHVPIKNPKSALAWLTAGESAVFAGGFAQTEGGGLLASHFKKELDDARIREIQLLKIQSTSFKDPAGVAHKAGTCHFLDKVLCFCQNGCKL